MLPDILKYLLEVVQIKEKSDSHDKEIKELQSELRRLTETVIRLEARVESNSEHESQERQKLIILLENALLRFDRRLPKDTHPPPSLGDGGAE